MANQSEVFIIGTVAEVQTRTGSTTRDGVVSEYVSGKVVIKVVRDGVENLIECNVFANKMTKSGVPSKTYPVILGLEGMTGKRVRVTGDFSEGTMVDQSSGEVRHFNRIDARFINPAYTSDTEDKAEFDFTGFVTTGLTERTDREGNLLGYRIHIAKADYSDTKAVVVRFDISKDSPAIASAVEANYVPGTTVSVHGVLGCVTTLETRTEEVAFGEPVVKQFAKTDKTYTITSGKEPLTEDNLGYYAEDRITKLIAGYKAADEAAVQKAQEQAAPTAPSAAAQAMASLSRKSLL